MMYVFFQKFEIIRFAYVFVKLYGSAGLEVAASMLGVRVSQVKH